MPQPPLDVESAWELVLNAVGRVDTTLMSPGSGHPALRIDESGRADYLAPANDDARALLDLFLPLCRPLAPGKMRVIGQMGQSLDGRIATVTGASRFINGDGGLTHLHRLRAISDAVIVGAGTAASDNPRLTVRRASGVNPVRVVIDRNRRVPDDHHLFTDETAPTLRLTGGDYHNGEKLVSLKGCIEVPCLGDESDPADPALILRVLGDFGLRRVFVEGGGQTVSQFLQGGLLDRLHVIVAPMIIGSGRPAFSLPEIDRLDEAWWPKAQFINLGSDMLFDLDFSANRGQEAT